MSVTEPEKRPDSVSLSYEFKKVTDEHGERLFKRDEWLSSTQIKGYIASYLSKKAKSVTEAKGPFCLKGV